MRFGCLDTFEFCRRDSIAFYLDGLHNLMLNERDRVSNLFKRSGGGSKRDFTLSPQNREDPYHRSLLGLHKHCFDAYQSFGCMGSASFPRSNGLNALKIIQGAS